MISRKNKVGQVLQQVLFYKDGDTTVKMDLERSERGEDPKLVYLLS